MQSLIQFLNAPYYLNGKKITSFFIGLIFTQPRPSLANACQAEDMREVTPKV